MRVLVDCAVVVVVVVVVGTVVVEAVFGIAVVVVLFGTTSSKIHCSTRNRSFFKTYNWLKFLVPYSPLLIGSTNSSHILSEMDLSCGNVFAVGFASDS